MAEDQKDAKKTDAEEPKEKKEVSRLQAARNSNEQRLKTAEKRAAERAKGFEDARSEAERRGAGFEVRSAGMGADAGAMNRAGTTSGPPADLQPDTEQVRYNVPANTMAEERLHQKAAQEVREALNVQSDEDPGVVYVATPEPGLESSEAQNYAADVLIGKVGRVGGMAPKTYSGGVPAGYTRTVYQGGTVGQAAPAHSLNEGDAAVKYPNRGPNIVVVDTRN